MTSIIQGPVAHACGWESDGGAFPQGAGCPDCGEPITADSVQELAEPVLEAPAIEFRDLRLVVGDPEWLASVTVAEAAAYVSRIETIPELSAFLAMETAGKNRKGVLAAIDAHGTELATASLAKGSSS